MCSPCLEEVYAGAIYGLHTGDFRYRYIGQTKRPLNERYKEHQKDAKSGSNLAVHRWMRKYGIEKVQICIIESFGEKDVHLLSGREIYHISVAKKMYTDILNLTDGGEKGTPGYQYTEEDRAKMSAAKVGKKLSEEHKANIALGGIGKHVPTEKIILNGRTIGTSNKGRKHTEETRSKMSISHLGNKNGKKGLHNRWHINRKTINTSCEFCISEPIT